MVQPCATQDHEWEKAGAGSFVADIDLLVIIIDDANSNKTKVAPALVAVPIAAGVSLSVSLLPGIRPYGNDIRVCTVHQYTF